MTLSVAAREIANIARRRRLSYDQFRAAVFQVRRHLELKPSKSARQLPKILSDSELRRYFEAVTRGGNVGHELMLKLMLCTGLRVSELAHVKIADVDAEGCRIYVERGKGDKSRYALFREDLRLPLRTFIEGKREEGEYLFESSHKRAYSIQHIGRIVRHYADVAGLETRVHPHLFRHMAISALTKEGVPDAAIQLISGHASRESLKIYQHMALSDVAEQYQAAMRKMPS